MEPVAALREIAFWLERAGAPTFRVRAFRRAALVLRDMPDLDKRVQSGRLTELVGIGTTTAQVIEQAHRGNVPDYLLQLRSQAEVPEQGQALREALRGDCHTHSDWSDGGSPLWEMAEAARSVGHEWMVLSDHSPSLTIARGLSPERLRAQLDEVAELNACLAPFRVLTGIEVDIDEYGGLDQDEGLLAELDLVVASMHSMLRMDSAAMTDRMCTALRNPMVNVLGHCTGRLLGQRSRPASRFDAKAVFTTCREQGVAVEINARPERADPPDELLAFARDIGCDFTIDSDAHAPGQLDWIAYGCARAQQADVPVERLINSRAADDVLAWARA